MPPCLVNPQMLLVLLVVAVVARAQVLPIVFPPGVYVGPGGSPPFKQYGGYITLDSGKRIYAWFCEASVTPEKAPVVIFQVGTCVQRVVMRRR